MRERWDGPFIVKGLLDPADAERAVDVVGATGVVVSNHGGRQLDGAVASPDALPDIADAVGDRATVLIDSGVRTGSDVVTAALALGADAVMIGRPYIYGLAVAGGRGVTAILDILPPRFGGTIILMGVAGVTELERGHVSRGAP
jgi:isopentenyl diphosphate isomerase/L-lactate dehydrogenase-like FMN-dependent dehydrogenase